ncbi:MAG TPA: aminotransferase class IV, partial [Candidatus Humimicrobiaceae bacterium]|nr:aminotransferase class IV [Candidatus Humimicrobiaceae bacterium]
RQTVIDICTENRIRVRQIKIHYRDLTNADEVFKTSSIAGIVPVKKIDRFILAGKVPGPVTARLMISYMDKVRPSNLQ